MAWAVKAIVIGLSSPVPGDHDRGDPRVAHRENGPAVMLDERQRSGRRVEDGIEQERLIRLPSRPLVYQAQNGAIELELHGDLSPLREGPHAKSTRKLASTPRWAASPVEPPFAL